MTKQARLCLAIPFLLLFGCAAEPEGPTPTEHIEHMAANLPDAANKPERWLALFATGAAPGDADRPKYGYLQVRPMTAKITGDDGTAHVLIEDGRTGNKVGEADWTFVKEAGGWKIKTAPLP